MLEKYCDILVIGTELPGLVAGAFLARRGLSVKTLDTNFYSDHPSLPDPLCLTHVKSKLLRSILGRLNVPEGTTQNFLNRETTLQILFPKHRIDIFENPLVYEEEIDREFPEFYEKLKNFYETLARVRHQTDVNELFQLLIPNSWRERQAFKKFIKEHNLDEKNQEFLELLNTHPELKAYLYAQYLLAYHTICKKPFSHQIAELFNPSDGAVFSVVAGSHELTNILLDRIIKHDGTVRKKTTVEKLLFRNGVFEGAEISGTQDQIFAKYIIWNTSLEKLKEVLPNKWRFRGIRKKCNIFPTHHHWFTVRYQINTKFAPDPMKQNSVIILDPTQELGGTNLLYMQLNHHDNGKSTIDVNFILPKSAIEEENQFFKKYFDDIKKILVSLMPFSENHLKQIFPIEDSEESQDLLFPLRENDFEVFKYSASTHGITQQTENHFYELFPLHFRTPAPNLFLSHPMVFQPLGMDAKLTLGLKITDVIWQETEKEKRRAMKSERRIA